MMKANKKTTISPIITLIVMCVVFTVVTLITLLCISLYFRFFDRQNMGINMIYIFRVPLVVALSIVPTFLYVKSPTLHLIEPNSRGIVHSVLTHIIAFYTLWRFNYFYHMNPIIIVAYVLIMYLFAKYMSIQYYKRFKESAEELRIQKEALIEDFNKQHEATRKLAHDQKNILFSLESYINDEDIDGLQHYFYDKIIPTCKTADVDGPELASVGLIKVPEISSILKIKLIDAKAKNINVELDVKNEITHNPPCTVALVRMLGIILDNAVEELMECEDGVLLVECQETTESVVYTVQNTCRPNTPALNTLMKSGFSTKGDGRGLGLSNLYEIADSTPSIFLQSKIVKDHFIQTIRVQKEMR